MHYFKNSLIVSVFCLGIISQLFPVTEAVNARDYLQKYGYLPERTGGDEDTPQSLVVPSSALRKFQRFVGLRQTGILDNQTINMMNTPRCGNKDTIGQDSRRRKRYTLLGSRWRIPFLTYQITKYPARLDRVRVDQEIEKAFRIWSNVARIQFRKQTTGQAHINIRFVRGHHGDNFPFDGRGGELGHAFAPRSGGDVHMDDDEFWTAYGRAGFNLLQVAAHEFGHSLGLSHSDQKYALMAPTYRYNPSLRLHIDDVMAIRALYGSRDNPGPIHDDDSDSPPTSTSDAPDLCQDSRIDTVTQIQNGNIYVFKGNFYWKIGADGIEDGFPRRIADNWDGLEGNLDASFTAPNGQTFFFKERRYWRFRNRQMDAGYPKLISEGFNGIPDNLDAAFVWSGNGKTYFFKGDKYWRYDDEIDPPVSSKYPLPISGWRGLPNNIDAAFRLGYAKTYFFVGDKYYKFDDLEFKVESGNVSYPKLTSVGWLSCQAISFH